MTFDDEQPRNRNAQQPYDVSERGGGSFSDPKGEQKTGKKRQQDPNAGEKKQKQQQKEKKNIKQAPSQEDWEGGGSRPEQEEDQFAGRKGRGAERDYTLPRAGGANEADEEDAELNPFRKSKRNDFEQEDDNRSERSA